MILPWVHLVWHTAAVVPLPLPRVVITPTPSAPQGRYGAALRAAWIATPADAVGLVVVEQDLAIDPAIIVELRAAVTRQPRTIWAVPYRLWPTSTGRSIAIWAHRADDGSPGGTTVSADQPCPRRCAAVGLGCTYLPGPLLNRLADRLETWTYPMLDTDLSAWARGHHWPMRTTRREALHLHWGDHDATFHH